MLNDVFYGSAEGGWLYPLTNGNVMWPVKLGLAVAAGAVALAWLSRRLVERWPVAVVTAWLIVGTVAQVGLRSLVPYHDADLIGGRSDCFNTEAMNYPPGKYLRDFRELAPHLHFHVRANMAGKVLFYHALRAVAAEPAGMMWLLYAVSNVGALLAYLIVRELYADRTAGLAALLLYFFLPSKLFFLPLLNAVTPVFILLPLWLLVRYLATRHCGLLLATGVALYGLVLFEPLPLVTGLTFLALIGRAWVQGSVRGRHLLAISTIVPAAFFAADLAVYWKFGYEIVGAFLFALHDAEQFNAANGRPYDIWVVVNLIETLSNTGVLTSAVFLGIASVGTYRCASAWLRNGMRVAAVVACEPSVCLAVSVLASLVVVDVMGINRGETVRLWIFLGTFIQLPVAGFCARRPVLFSVVLAGSILQACVGLGSRGFVAPG